MTLNCRLELAYTTTIVMVVVAAAASIAGVLIPGLYAEDALAAAMRGPDFATLVALRGTRLRCDRIYNPTFELGGPHART